MRQTNKIMEGRISRRLSDIRPSASIRLAQRANELKASGVDVIDLTAGQPDLPTPSAIVDAACRSMVDGKTGYTASRGLPQLRELISSHLHHKHGVDYHPDQILVTPGAKQAIYDILVSLLNPGDEVLIPEPSWLSYRDMVVLAGGVPVPVPSTPDQKFLCTIEEIEAKTSRNTRLLILNNPVNPTGVVWPREVLADLAEFCRNHQVVVLSDQIYDDIVFGHVDAGSIVEYGDMPHRTLLVNGFSKSYSMTGFRIGYLVAPKTIASQILTVHEQIVTCAPSVSQHAAIAALKLPQKEHTTNICRTYGERRFKVVDLCRRKGLEYIDPDATFYIMIRVDRLHPDSEKAGELILRRARVACVPGSAYGRSSEGFVRLSLTQDTDLLLEAIERIDGLINT